MKRRRWTLAALVLSMTVITSSCLDELGEIFEILAFSEAEDPELRRLAERLEERRAEEQANEAIDDWIATGDRRFLYEALRLRPDDSQIRAFALIQARLDGDPSAISAAENALAYSKARELDTNDPQQIQRAIDGNLFVAQTMALSGGCYDCPWDPPGPDAPPDQVALFEAYCDTVDTFRNEYGESLSFVYVAPCPGQG